MSRGGSYLHLGYDAPHLAFLLRDLPVQVLARMRSDRVPRRPVPPGEPHTRGRPPRHGGEFAFGQPDTWGAPAETVTGPRVYGSALARSWDRLHPKLRRSGPLADAPGPRPVPRRADHQGRRNCTPTHTQSRSVAREEERR